MQFKFTKVTTKQRKQRTFVPTKSERLLAMLEAGERGSMDYFEKDYKIGTPLRFSPTSIGC